VVRFVVLEYALYRPDVMNLLISKVVRIALLALLINLSLEGSFISILVLCWRGIWC